MIVRQGITQSLADARRHRGGRPRPPTGPARAAAGVRAGRHRRGAAGHRHAAARRPGRAAQARGRNAAAAGADAVSTYPDRQYAVRSLKLGAAGYLNKSADSEQITARDAPRGRRPAVHHAAGGRAAGRARWARARRRRRAAARAAVAPRVPGLRLLARGRSVGEIAEQLSLSSNTVSTYRARILDKTGARNDVELALYAVRRQQQAAGRVGLALQADRRRRRCCVRAPARLAVPTHDLSTRKDATMSDYFDPYDADRPLRWAAAAAHHAPSAEHAAADAARAQRDAPSSRPSRNDFVEAALMKALFPQDALRRSFLRAVGRRTAMAAIGSVLPIASLQAMAQDKGALEKKDLKIGFIPITCATPLIMAAPAGLLQQAGPERRGGEDGRLGADPRQDAQQGVRRHALPEPDAAGHQPGPGLDRHADERGHHPEHQRPGHHAGQQAQGQARPEELEGLQVRRALRVQRCTTSCCATTWPKRG